MEEKLREIERRYEELSERLGDPQLIADKAAWRECVKEHARLEEVVGKIREVRQAESDLAAARSMLDEASDESERDWLWAEADQQEHRLARLQTELKRLIIRRDPRDEKGVIMEIRAGTGGDEAALFAADLYRMYARFAERHGWKTELMSANETGIGGFKEIVVGIQGRGAYSQLKYESGVHRVQRVPETEAAGRIHTSTATVAVLPEVDDVDVEIRPEDLQVDTYRSGGAGGQHVNKTESAVRITHLPTGIIVACQDERSQHKNRDRAMKILRAKLYDLAVEQQAAEQAAERRAQVGSGERSEKIRTYNFPQGRVTDHRIGLSLYKLDLVLDGDIDELIDGLLGHFEAEALAKAE